MLVLLTLHVFEFLPSGLALLNGEAHSASHSGPVGTKFWVFCDSQRHRPKHPNPPVGSVVVGVVASACVLWWVVDLGLLLECRLSLLRVVLVNGWVVWMVLSHRMRW